MQIIKKINVNAALALDHTGTEVVVLGRGLGFPAVPYELQDLTRIKRSFYDVDPRYVEMIAGLPQPVLLASGKQVDAGGGSMLPALAREYPEVYACAQQIARYFAAEWGWQCSREELLYLMLHINRVREK